MLLALCLFLRLFGLMPSPALAQPMSMPHAMTVHTVSHTAQTASECHEHDQAAQVEHRADESSTHCQIQCDLAQAPLLLTALPELTASGASIFYPTRLVSTVERTLAPTPPPPRA